MIAQKFFAWADAASPERRAAAAECLARMYLAQDRTVDQAAVETALTVLLDDPSLQVRRALAVAFAGEVDAPRHVVLALASEPSEVSALVLARSPLLSNEDLIDCAAVGDDLAQASVASRSGVAPPLAAALAEVGCRASILALLGNPGAMIVDPVFRRIYERFSSDGEVREALLAHERLPADLRLAIASLAAAAIADLVASRNWLGRQRLDRVTRESLDRAAVAVAAASRDSVREIAAHLRVNSSLTVAVLLRSLLSGERALFEAALAELSAQPWDRVRGLVRNWPGGGFAALYARAGLPRDLLPAFRAALSAQDDLGVAAEASPARLRRILVERVLTACESIESSGLAAVISLFRRLACEAAREDARLASESWRPGPPLLAQRPIEIDMEALEAELMAA